MDTISGGIQLLEVSDASGQNCVTVDEVEPDSSVTELVNRLLADIGAKQEDAEGRPLTFRARLEREGRHLHGAERVGDVLKSGDRLVLQTSIDAGRGA